MNLERGMSAAAILHRLTRHGSLLDAADRRRLVAFRPLDPSNRPAPFKRYVGREPVPLTRDFGCRVRGQPTCCREDRCGVVEGPWDEERLARLLFFSNGVSRTSRSAFGETTYFSHRDVGRQPAPGRDLRCVRRPRRRPRGHPSFRAARVRAHRACAAATSGARSPRAAVDPRVAEAPVTLVVSGIPWRTGWKYAERGFRHLYWDAGTMLANLLALEPSASVRVGFVDDQVSPARRRRRCLGVPACARRVGRLGHRRAPRSRGGRRCDRDARPCRRSAISQHRSSSRSSPRRSMTATCADATAVKQWRTTASSLGTPALVEVKPPTSRV